MSVFAVYGKIPGAWPTGITQSRGPNGTYEQPHDPQYNTRGEAGYYPDTPLGEPPLTFMQRLKIKSFYKNLRKASKADRSGSPFLGFRGLSAIPTDFELAKVMGYTPVQSGWIAAQQGFLTPPWLPPNNTPQGGYALPIQPNDGGGQPENPNSLRFWTPERNGDPAWNTTTLGGFRDGTPATAEDIAAQLNAHNDRVFALALVSTTAVAVSAIITIFRTLHLIRKD